MPSLPLSSSASLASPLSPSLSLLRHISVLCCNGGVPFVDFSASPSSSSSSSSDSLYHHFTTAIDPTDWIADDIAGASLLVPSEGANRTVAPSVLASLPDTVVALLRAGSLPPLERCDLFNLTFTTTADQSIYERLGAALSCRCPRAFSGVACEQHPAIARTLALSADLTPSPGDPGMLIVLCAIVLALFFLAFMVMRGCFCDCFGPWSLSRRRRAGEGTDDADMDGPVDPAAIARSLAKVRAYEERQRATAGCVEHRRLLLPTVSERCAGGGGAAPYFDACPPPSAPPPPSGSHFARCAGCEVYPPPPPPPPPQAAAVSSPPRPHSHSPPPAYESTENLAARTTTAI